MSALSTYIAGSSKADFASRLANGPPLDAAELVRLLRLNG